MKYLIQTFAADTEAPAPSTDDMSRMIRRMQEIDVRLASEGVLVSEQGLDHPSTAHVVRGDTIVAGSHADTPHSLQGYWVVDTSTSERAEEIAREISAIAFGAPVEIRRCMDRPDG